MCVECLVGYPLTLILYWPHQSISDCALFLLAHRLVNECAKDIAHLRVFLISLAPESLAMTLSQIDLHPDVRPFLSSKLWTSDSKPWETRSSWSLWCRVSLASLKIEGNWSSMIISRVFFNQSQYFEDHHEISIITQPIYIYTSLCISV